MLVADDFFDDPYPIYDRLRTEDPVHWSEPWGAWLVTRYADAVSIASDHSSFSNAGRRSSHLTQLAPELRPRMTPLFDHFNIGMGNTDPPEHERYRELVSASFRPRAVRAMQPRIEEVANELIDRISGRTEFDLVRDFAYPLPATLIADLVGFPRHDRDRFKAWADDFVGFQGAVRADAAAAERNLASFLHARDWLTDLAAERRRHHQDDLLTGLVTGPNESLSDDDIVATCVVLMVGGHETTTSLIGTGMLTLLRNPDQQELLRSDRQHLTAAVEECLRFESPIQQSLRITKTDVEISGRRIRAGQLVRLMLGAANRDPQRFHDSNVFDITRRENKHLAFLVGIHFCLGAWLARLEAEIAFGLLLTRLPRLYLRPQHLQWMTGTINRGLRSLLVTTES